MPQGSDRWDLDDAFYLGLSVVGLSAGSFALIRGVYLRNLHDTLVGLLILVCVALFVIYWRAYRTVQQAPPDTPAMGNRELIDWLVRYDDIDDSSHRSDPGTDPADHSKTEGEE